MGPDEDSSLMNSSFVWSVRPVRFLPVPSEPRRFHHVENELTAQEPQPPEQKRPHSEDALPTLRQKAEEPRKLPKTRAARAATALVCVEET